MYAGKKIKSLRQKLGFNQEDFSKELNISQPYYSAIESGKKQVSKKLIDTFKLKWGEDLTLDTGNNTNSASIEMGVNSGGVTGGNGINIASNKDNSLTKDDLVYMMEALANSVYKGDSKVEYYFKHPASKLTMIFNNLRSDFETVYNDYFKLIEVSNKFGAPDFMDEKFPNNKIDFKTYLKNTDTELELDNEEVTDKKLLKCIKIVDYERLIIAYQGNISDLINYMNRYYDLYDSVFEKYHADAVKAKKLK